MIDLLTFIKALGAQSLNTLWLPLVIWTILAATAIGFFRTFKKIPPVYQYHGRVAIMWALPAGIFASALLRWVSHFGSEVTVVNAKFIVISSPITAAAANPTPNWADPVLWLGILTALGAGAALFGVFRLVANISSLKSLTQNVNGLSNTTRRLLSDKNQTLLEDKCTRTTLLFSQDIDVPCTFGWRQKWVLLPASLLDNPEKLNIAVRHELMHICQSDYLLNATLQGIKALFYIHPLIHLLEKETEEYRELYCDQHVLADPDISEKRYAELLFELSSKHLFRPTAAVSMSVHPSTLKKRIQIMKNRSHSIPPLKRSIALMLLTGLLFTGFMACSDIEEGGITQAEIINAQANMHQEENEPKPLYLVNGEEMTDTVSRIKPKYIESISVLKGEKAIAAYGEKGKYGVVKITLNNKDKALSDLRTDEQMAVVEDKKSYEANSVFVSVENQPKIKGGIQSLYKNLNYPESCKKEGLEGRVLVQFIVNKQGKVEDPQIIQGIGGGCDQAALDAVKQLSFTPGMQDGKAVKAQFSLPIIFKL